MQDGQAAFNSAINALSENIKVPLNMISSNLKTYAQEIRLVAGFFPQIIAENRAIDITGHVITKEALNDCLISLCRGSVHSHQKELSSGYISLEDGHRAGFAATAVYGPEGRLLGFRNVTGIVIRVARDHPGASIPIINNVFKNGLCGLIIAGAPASGKTTVLRDIARQLSCKGEKVAVIDERGELGSCGRSLVLKGYEKAQGMLMALRMLSPQVILCDEIGELSEAKAVSQALNSGVFVITTVHAASKEELLNRAVVKELLMSRAFKYTVILSDRPVPCSINEVFDNDELVAENNRNSFYYNKLLCIGSNESKSLFNENILA